jgi:hypothetical protein
VVGGPPQALPAHAGSRRNTPLTSGNAGIPQGTVPRSTLLGSRSAPPAFVRGTLIVERREEWWVFTPAAGAR